MLAFRSRVAKRRGHGRAALSPGGCSAARRPAVWDHALAGSSGRRRNLGGTGMHRNRTVPGAESPSGPCAGLTDQADGSRCCAGRYDDASDLATPSAHRSPGTPNHSLDRPELPACSTWNSRAVTRPFAGCQTNWLGTRADFQFRCHTPMTARRADDVEGRRYHVGIPGSTWNIAAAGLAVEYGSSPDACQTVL